MFSQNRDQMRAVFLEAWRRRQEGLPMEALHLAVANVIAEHPEYHALMEQGDEALHRDFTPDGGATNPFLHMGMHLSLREQIGTNRPAGIAALFPRLCEKLGSSHDAEHAMLEVLGKHLWQSSRSGLPPNDADYLEDLEKLLTN